MPKYRRLTTAELQPLEKEFVEFLVLNGIVAEDWLKIKTESPEKADSILDNFSDVVFEKILRQTIFLEQRSKERWLSFHCQQTQIVMIGLSSVDSTIDFTIVKKFEELRQKDLEIFTQTKAYKMSRESELFQMMNNGAVKSDGNSYKQFAMVLAELNASNN